MWYNLEYRGKVQINSYIFVEVMVHLSAQTIGSQISLDTFVCSCKERYLSNLESKLATRRQCNATANILDFYSVVPW